MIRLRWDEPRNDDASSPAADWRLRSLVLATLFLNFSFFLEQSRFIRFSGPPLVYCALLVGTALLLAGLFYIGPALAAQAGKRPLFEVAAASLGSVPAFLFRLSCTLFLILWLASLLSAIDLLGVRWPLRDAYSPVVSSLLGGGILFFLFATGLRSARTTAKLALFTNKLALAMLVAALIRVRGGWSEAWGTLMASNGLQNSHDVLRSLGVLFFNNAPLALLASVYAHRSHARRDVALTGICGLALPFASAICLAGFVNQATYATHRGLGNQASFAAALWSGDSQRYIPAKGMLAAVTMFGAVRFGARALASSVSMIAQRGMARRLVIGFCACAIATLSAMWTRYPLDFSEAFEWLVRIVIAVSAVLTADYLARDWRTGRSGKIDWAGSIACAIGLTVPYVQRLVSAITVIYAAPGVEPESWWHPWLIPIYGASFVACLIARFAQRYARPRSAT